LPAIGTLLLAIIATQILDRGGQPGVGGAVGGRCLLPAEASGVPGAHGLGQRAQREQEGYDRASSSVAAESRAAAPLPS